jgi:hypothetical protein
MREGSISLFILLTSIPQERVFVRWCARVCARARARSLFLLNSTLSWAIYHGTQVQAIVGCVIFASFVSEVVHSQIGESLRVCVLNMLQTHTSP